MQKVAIRYHRFSSEGQSNGSIERQEMITDHWCRNNNVLIQDSFNDDGVSAKTFDRPDMKKLMNFIKEHKNKIDYLVVAELTRFSRQLGDAINMVQDIQKRYAIKIVSANRNMIYDAQDATSFFMMSIEFTLGNTENLKRESDINGGIYTAKAKEKRFIGSVAPFGYRKEGKGASRVLVIVKHEAAVIREIFDSYLKNCSHQQILADARKQGFVRKGNSVIQKILTNPLYIGQQHVRPYKDMPGGLFPVNCKPIIDELTWNQVQHKIKTPAGWKPAPNEHLPLRGVLHCHCGRLLTGAPSRGRHGGLFYYYKCNTSSKHNNLNAKKLHAQFEEMLKELSLDEGMISMVKEFSYKQMEVELKNDKKNAAKAYKQLQQVEKDLASIEEKYIRNALHFDTYNRYHQEAVSKRNLLRAQIEDYSKVDNKIYDLLDQELIKLTDLNYVYNSGSMEDKQEFIREGFDNRLYYRNNIYRTPYLHEIFQHNLLTLKQKRLLELDKKGDFRKEIPPGGAPGSTIEPLISFLTFVQSIRVA